MEKSRFYRRFSLNPTSILPQDNDDTIFNTKPPLSPSLDLSDSGCSFRSSIRVHCRGASESNGHDIDNAVQEFCSGSNYNSEPEDMQDYVYVQNKSPVNALDCMNSSIEKDKSLNNMDKPEDFGPFVYTSSPLALRGKKVSLSLQDMSSIETFPLLPKTNNGFSSETIPSQSLSSTSKSKDSGFQRSASCLSLNSGNRSYDHVQSKVKQYIRDIKNSEESRKKRKQSVMSLSKDLPLISQKKSDTTCSINSITETIDNDSDLVSVLKNELKEKDSTLKQLQENYNSLLQKYAEAVNQIDFMRLRNSLNNSYRSDLTVSNEDLTDNNLNYSKNLFPTCHSNNINRCQTEDFTTSLPNRFSSLSNNNNVHEQRPEVARVQRSESLDYKIFNTKQDSTQLPTKEERPQSSSSSTIVSNPQRTKTITLGPISKYYSSSSRLGKTQNVPLPSSKMANSEQSPQHSASGSHNNALLSTTDHSPLRSYRMRNISKVSPFQRVHSYLENFKKMREDSLPTRIDSNGNTSSDESTHEAYTDKNRSKNYTTNQSKLSNRDSSRTSTNRSKSEQNLSNHKIFTELPNQNVRSSSGRGLLYSNGGGPTPHTLLDSNRKKNIETYAFQLRGSEKRGKKCSRNLLARGDAFDSHSSLDENFSDDVDGFGHNMEFEKHLSDDSSSISSSIFSLPKDEGYHPPHKKNQTSRSETDWKTVSHTKSVKSTVWEKRQSYQTSTVPKRKKGTPDRVCYSPKNRRVPVKKTPSQEDVGLKCRTTPSSNQKSEFHKKLKIYTHILKSKPNRDVGVQVSEQKQLEEPEDSVNTNRLDCLSEASEYLKQMKQGMDRLCDYIENLKVDTGNKRQVIVSKSF